MLTVALDSDILYLNGLGFSIVVLCSWEAANDLLDKRSAIYSSRYVPILRHMLIRITA